jgi:hypothetical protein
MKTHYAEIKLEYFKVPHYNDGYIVLAKSLIEELKIFNTGYAEHITKTKI